MKLEAPKTLSPQLRQERCRATGPQPVGERCFG